MKYLTPNKRIQQNVKQILKKTELLLNKLFNQSINK